MAGSTQAGFRTDDLSSVMASPGDSDNRASVMVVCDAGAAGRELLARSDFDVFWALEPSEAVAVLQNQPPQVVLTREQMCEEVLSWSLAHRRRVPVVVLLEAGNWGQRQAFLQKGAAALVEVASRDRILEAVSELTGRGFPAHVRVPFSEFVEVLDGRSTRLVETTDLSKTGLGLRYLPDASPGQTVRVQIDSLHPPLSLGAAVIRVDEDTVGLRFVDNSDEVLERLETLVSALSKRNLLLEMPRGLTVDLLELSTRDLVVGEPHQDVASFKMMLHHAVARPDGPRDGWPRWLVNLERRLTAIERRCLRQDSAVSPVAAAVELRIELARAHADPHIAFPTAEHAQRVMEFCQRLTEHVEVATPRDLVDITLIRGRLLRAVYAAAVAPADAAAHAA